MLESEGQRTEFTEALTALFPLRLRLQPLRENKAIVEGRSLCRRDAQTEDVPAIIGFGDGLQEIVGGLRVDRMCWFDIYQGKVKEKRGKTTKEDTEENSSGNTPLAWPRNATVWW